MATEFVTFEQWPIKSGSWPHSSVQNSRTSMLVLIEKCLFLVVTSKLGHNTLFYHFLGGFLHLLVRFLRNYSILHFGWKRYNNQVSSSKQGLKIWQLIFFFLFLWLFKALNQELSVHGPKMNFEIIDHAVLRPTVGKGVGCKKVQVLMMKRSGLFDPSRFMIDGWRQWSFMLFLPLSSHDHTVNPTVMWKNLFIMYTKLSKHKD